MAISRDMGLTLPAMAEVVLVTCGGSISTAAASTAAQTFLGVNSTADSIVSTGGPLAIGGTSTVNSFKLGRVIDRLAAPLGAQYFAAFPAAYMHATRGSTDADRRLQLGVALFHGDSSGGGDMVEYSTASRPAIRTYFSSARTTDMLSWETGGRSTGPLEGVSNPAVYSLDAAKRFIQVAVFAGKDLVTTSAYGDEQARVGATITLVAGNKLPQDTIPSLERNSPESTSTSTA